MVKRKNVQKTDPKFRVFDDAEIVVSPQCHTHFYKKHVVLRARFSVRRDVYVHMENPHMSNCVVSSFKADRSTTGCFCEVVRDEQETTLDVCVCVSNKHVPSGN